MDEESAVNGERRKSKWETESAFAARSAVEVHRAAAGEVAPEEFK